MWQETNNNERTLQAKMIDVVFRIECQRLLVDHAAALADAVCTHAPLIKQSVNAGIHPIHVAGSQNGWERPADGKEYLLLSKRTRFKVRVEAEDASSIINLLSGVTLNVNELPMRIVSGQPRNLSPAQTLFSRYTYFDDLDNDADETTFVERIVNQCQAYGFSPTKILCGKEHTVTTSNGLRLTRSVLLADVPSVQSLTLQDNGFGNGRTIGCGLLIPHKDTGAVHDSEGMG